MRSTGADRLRSSGIAVCMVLLGACGTEGSSTAVSSSPPPATSMRLDAAECDATPPKGTVDRSAHGLAFRTGGIRIGTKTTPVVAPPPLAPPALAPTPPPPGAQRPPAGPAPASMSPSNSDRDRTCYGFTKWGNADPSVPPDSLLFVFKGPGTDGAQIEFLVGELTGGVLPPIGDVRPSVGPLNGPINAQIGMSVDGVYYQSPTCALRLTAMSTELGAGTFTCTAATRSTANPLDPDDDVPFDDDTTSAATSPAIPATPAPGSPTTIGLSGWFEIRR